ncbi:Nn.00g095710.m01.CDS01 [Neocucurbitaria sp. VM-36]
MGLAARATAAPEPYVVPPSQQFDGNDGSWSTFKISVGTPGQDFRVLPSTKSGVTYVIAPEGCIAGVDPSDCANLRGAEIFQSSQNIGYQVNVSTSWSAIGQYDVDLEEALNYTSQGLFGFDKVSLGPAADSSSLSLDHQVVAGIADPDYFMGVLPLGQTESSFSSLSESLDSLLYQLRNGTKIPSLSYAYTAGAKYRLKSVFGDLILGGYDSTRFEANDNDFSYTFSTDPSKLLAVGVESIMGTNTLRGTFSLTSGAHFSVIDSTVPHLWLPEDVCDQFETAFGLTYDSQTDLYLVNDTIHSELLSKNPTITIKLVNSLEDTSTNYTNIQLPYAAFDLQASYPFYENATNYFPIRRAANDTQYVLGRTLLQEAYLIVDYERANFTVAQAVFPDPLPSAKVVTINPPNSNSNNSNTSSGLSTGAIAGIAVGGAVLLILAALAFFFFRRRRTQKQRYELAGNQVSETGSHHHLTAGGAPMKSPGPQELSGTPLTELASPQNEHFNGYPQDSKTFISMNDTPQELHGESRTPITPRWQEVHMPLRPPGQHDMDRESNGSRSVSRGPSDDGFATGELGPRSGVSPLTGQFQPN